LTPYRLLSGWTGRFTPLVRQRMKVHNWEDYAIGGKIITEWDA
jgi:hypothetical protein